MARMSIDEVLRSMVVVGDGIIRGADMKQKVTWDVQYLSHPEFPFRVRITCGKVNTGMALPRKITLSDFEKRFAEKIDYVKTKQPKQSLFSL